jgi:hypothetical protein
LRAEKILEILSAVPDASDQIPATLKLATAVGFIVVIPVEHDLEPTLRRRLAKIVNERPVLVEWMDGPATTVFFRDTFTRTSAVERHDRERDGAEASQVPVRRLQVVWRRKEAGVIVADAKLHG